MFYSVCGLAIQSSRTMDFLEPIETDSPDVQVDWRPPLHQNGSHDWFRDAPGFFRAARDNGGYLVRFDGRADFGITPEGDAVWCRPAPGVPDSTVLHMLLDHVIPLLLSRRGNAVLHGSAVELDGRGVAFLGPSGRGKSTMATFFCRELGCPLITDDCLLTRAQAGGFVMIPSYPGVRVWPDSKDALVPEAGGVRVWHDAPKMRVAGGLGLAGRPVPLHHLYLLQPPGPEFAIEEVTGAEAIRALVACHYLLDSEDPREMDNNFRLVSELARRGRCYRLTVPRDWDRLPLFANALARHARMED